jgi:uncharacterized membrane protein YccC
LAELIALLHDCDRLQREIVLPGRSSPLHGPKRARGYVYHRDPLMAARAGLGAAIGIAIGCAFWIGTAWAEGGLAVSVLGVCCALFGNADAPAPNVMKYLIGSIYGVAISLAYSFVILPRVTDFVVLVAVLAPALLLAGSLQARPQTTYMALGITLTIPILAGLGTAYTGNFADTLNSVVALFAAIGFGAVSMTLFQTVPVDAAIGRLLRASRRDVRRRALGGGGDEAHWAGLMIDRTALLLPRLRLSRRAGSDILDETLRYLRVGHAVGRLRQTIRRCDGDTGDQGRQLLSAIAAHFGARDTAAPDLIQRTDDLTALVATSAGHDHHHHAQLLDRLIDLRFALNGHGVTAHGA